MDNGYNFVGTKNKLNGSTLRAIVGEKFYNMLDKCYDIEFLKLKKAVVSQRLSIIEQEANFFAEDDDLQPHKYDNLENSLKYSNLQHKSEGYEYYNKTKKEITLLKAKRSLLNRRISYLKGLKGKK